MNVTIVGANGEAGLSIIDALSPSPNEFVSCNPQLSKFLILILTEIDRNCATCFHQQTRDPTDQEQGRFRGPYQSRKQPR